MFVVPSSLQPTSTHTFTFVLNECSMCHTMIGEWEDGNMMSTSLDHIEIRNSGPFRGYECIFAVLC